MGATTRLTYGVMGSASGKQSKEALRKLTELGRSIGERGHILITGACPGLPYAAAQGAQSVGGLSIGISPGLSFDEHVHKYGSPTDVYDVLIYTGSGLMGREVLNIHSSDVVIIAGGRSGTLGEFAIAYDEGRLIGVLTGTGGIADRVPDLIKMCDKDTGAVTLYDDDPSRLVERLEEYYLNKHKTHPSVFFPSLPGENLALPEATAATKRARQRS